MNTGPTLNNANRAYRAAVGATIRRRRTALGLSQDRLAARAGMDRQTVLRLELGQHSILLDRVFDLAAALGTTAGDLLTDVDQHMRDNPPDRPTTSGPAVPFGLASALPEVIGRG